MFIYFRDSNDNGMINHTSSVDLDRFLGDHNAAVAAMNGALAVGSGVDQQPFSYKRVYFARKGSISTMAEKNNNIHAVTNSDFNGTAGTNNGSGGPEVTTSDSVAKAFLLQYRDNIQNEMNLAFLRNEAKKGKVTSFFGYNIKTFRCE